MRRMHSVQAHDEVASPGARLYRRSPFGFVGVCGRRWSWEFARPASRWCPWRPRWPSAVLPRGLSGRRRGCVQISAGGKTTSLGDHDTEEEAARAFDRAAINKCGLDGAKTNFDINDYLDEAEELLSATRDNPAMVF